MKKALEIIELIALVVLTIGMIATNVAKAISLWGTRWLIFVWMGFKIIGVVILLIIVLGTIAFILSISMWELCYFLTHCDRKFFKRKIYALVPLIAAIIGTPIGLIILAGMLVSKTARSLKRFTRISG